MVDLDYIKEVKEKYKSSSEWAKQNGLSDNQFLSAYFDNDQDIAKKKGYILNRMAEIEHRINIFLGTYFTPVSPSNVYNEFYNEVLSREFFTLSQKVHVFGTIGYHRREEFGDRFKGLTKILLELVKVRNLVAHGMKTHGTRPQIRFIGKDNITEIDEKFIVEFNENFDVAFLCLAELGDHLFKLRRETMICPPDAIATFK